MTAWEKDDKVSKNGKRPLDSNLLLGSSEIPGESYQADTLKNTGDNEK